MNQMTVMILFCFLIYYIVWELKAYGKINLMFAWKLMIEIDIKHFCILVILPCIWSFCKGVLLLLFFALMVYIA